MIHSAHSAGTAGSVLPVLAVGFPLLGGLAVTAAGRRNEKLRNLIAVACAGGAFTVCASMFPAVFTRGTSLSFNLDIFFGEFTLAVDPLSLVFALVASLLWLTSTVYAHTYIQHEERRTRYHVFSLFTEAATLGVFMAADFFALFVFFELMGLLAYLLVVHNQTYEARRAGVKYIFMTVYGGLSLLCGILLFTRYAGGLGFAAGPSSAYLATSACFLAGGFMMAGFGVKAGMVPLHVWLPLAHPAAPSPASALLSGVMIKAGAYGFLRLVQTFLAAPMPKESAFAAGRHLAGEAPDAAPVFIQNLHSLGGVIIILALLTMVVGMVLALVQDNVKRLLAYSSISQMGFILLGIGAAAYLGSEGSMGLAGSLYHIMNHAMFKGLLFLGVGAVYYATHELDMTRLGGLWRKMPFTTAFTCVAALGIMGIAAFNGYISKTLIHHAELEVVHSGGALLRVIDVTFIITAGGTVCYISKLITLTFFGHHRGGGGHAAKEVPWPMLLGMGTLAAGVVFFGVFPGVIIRKVIVPALHVFAGLDHHHVEHLYEIHFLSRSNLLAVLPPLLIGLTFFLVMRKWDLFRLRLPETAGIDFYYTRAEVGFLRLCFSGSKRYAELKAKYFPMAKSTGEYLYDWWQSLKKDYRRFRRTVFTRVANLPMDITGLASYMRAKQFTGDIAYGVIIIAAVVGFLALALLF